MFVDYFVGDCGMIDAYEAGFKAIRFSVGDVITIDDEQYKVEDIYKEENETAARLVFY